MEMIIISLRNVMRVCEVTQNAFALKTLCFSIQLTSQCYQLPISMNKNRFFASYFPAFLLLVVGGKVSSPFFPGIGNLFPFYPAVRSSDFRPVGRPVMFIIRPVVFIFRAFADRLFL